MDGVGQVRHPRGGFRADLVVEVLQTISLQAPQHRVGSGFEVLAQHAKRRLEARLAEPARDTEDWSIESPGGCGCDLCARFAGFLADRAGRAMTWPLKEEGRSHIHRQIDAYELPVEHRTRRSGRPYTLVLSKTPALFECEQRMRRKDAADLRWLQDQFDRRADAGD